MTAAENPKPDEPTKKRGRGRPRINKHTEAELQAIKYASYPVRPDGKPKHWRKRRTRREMKTAERYKNRKPNQKKTNPMKKFLGITGKQNTRIDMFKMSNYITIGKIEKALKAMREPPAGIVIHEYLLKVFWSLDITAVFSFLYYLEGQLLEPEDNGWFVSTYSIIKQYTGVNGGRVSAIVKEFRASGLIETKLLGVPAKQHYKIDHMVLMELLYETNNPRGIKDSLERVVVETPSKGNK